MWERRVLLSFRFLLLTIVSSSISARSSGGIILGPAFSQHLNACQQVLHPPVPFFMRDLGQKDDRHFPAAIAAKPHLPELPALNMLPKPILWVGQPQPCCWAPPFVLSCAVPSTRTTTRLRTGAWLHPVLIPFE